jgi:PqqD family protein of HPr-rel-A system
LGAAVPDAFSNLFDARWHCPGSDRWRFASWPDGNETVLFDARSGQTHFLAPLATAVLELLAAEPCSGRSVFDALSSRVEADELVALKEQLEDVVRRLEAAGLIDQCT